MTHLKIEQNNIQENVSSAVVEKLYELAINGDLDQSSNLSGNIHTTSTYQQYIDELRSKYPDLYINSDRIYVVFEDPEVLKLMATAFGDGVGVTDLQLLHISSLNGMFKENTNIVSFKELGNITGVTELGSEEFRNCENLEYVDLSNITNIAVDGGMYDNYTFSGCKNLFKNTGIFHMPKLVMISGQMLRGAEYVKMIIMESLIYTYRSNIPFSSCPLQALILPKTKYIDPYHTTYIPVSGDAYHPNSIFGNFGNLSVVELGAISSFSKQAITKSSSLKAIVLHEQDIIPSLNGYSSGNQITQWLPSNCNIYVPDDMVDTIQLDSVWSSFATRIKPISEYNFSDFVDDDDLVNYYNSVFNNQ